MAVTKSQRHILIENIQTAPKKASTAFAVGMWVEYDGSGYIKPLAAGSNPVLGLCLEVIASTDTDYASTKDISYDGIVDGTDRWLMPVTNGTATAAMVGLPFNVYTDSYGLDVSGAGVQFEVTRFISATLVEVRALLTS